MSISYRKIGGLHWLRIGRIRIAWCISHPRPADPIVVAARRAIQNS